MYLVDDKIMEFALGTYTGEVKLYAILSPNMKVVQIYEVLPEVYYEPPQELKKIVSEITGNLQEPIDNVEIYRYNNDGNKRVAFEDDILCVYHPYEKVK